MKTANNRLIIALDGLDYQEALGVVDEAKAFANTFKVGLNMFTAYGPKIVHEIKEKGLEVFLDLKLHDIPMQVARAVSSARTLAPKYLTIHCLGGRSMLNAAADALKDSHMKLLGVTILTSMNDEEHKELCFGNDIKSSVKNLAQIALSCGITNFVCSPQEAPLIKTLSPKAFLVCPGVRPNGVASHDQSRITTPYEAIKNGADAIVIGRPITRASSIKKVAETINHEIKNALET